MKPKLDSIKNEIYLKIGKNIILFQRIEFLLKFLISHQSFSSEIKEIKLTLEQQHQLLEKTTLGKLINQFLGLEPTFKNINDNQNVDDTRALISFEWKILVEPSSYEEKKKLLKLLVAERNDLVHHFYEKFDLTSIDELEEANQYLDEQYRKIKLEFENLQALTKFLIEVYQQELPNLVKIVMLQSSRLVQQLFEIAEKKHRDDGWTILSEAERLIRQEAPEEIDMLKKTFKQKSLKNLMIATELFEFIEETTTKGGMRVLYRIKSE